MFPTDVVVGATGGGPSHLKYSKTGGVGIGGARSSSSSDDADIKIGIGGALESDEPDWSLSRPDHIVGILACFGLSAAEAGCDMDADRARSCVPSVHRLFLVNLSPNKSSAT